jgi:CDP-diacylglycerol--glycerol-3-phosphate 3-phosphatidyltransferase
MNRNVPNLISILRILSCALFFIIGNNTTLFFLVATIIGLSDILDGSLARKYKVQSKLGAQLDSIADSVFFISIFIYFCVYKTDLLIQYKYVLIIGVCCKILPLIISLAKNRKIISIHTIMNKISGFIVIIGIILIVLFDANQIINIISLVISLAGIEESLIILINKDIELNTKSFFCTKK